MHLSKLLFVRHIMNHFIAHRLGPISFLFHLISFDFSFHDLFVFFRLHKYKSKRIAILWRVNLYFYWLLILKPIWIWFILYTQTYRYHFNGPPYECMLCMFIQKMSKFVSYVFKCYLFRMDAIFCAARYILFSRFIASHTV